MACNVRRINLSTVIPVVAGLLLLSLTACATQRYGHMAPVSPGERTNLNCEQIALEIEEAEFFMSDTAHSLGLGSGENASGHKSNCDCHNVQLFKASPIDSEAVNFTLAITIPVTTRSVRHRRG